MILSLLSLLLLPLLPLWYAAGRPRSCFGVRNTETKTDDAVSIYGVRPRSFPRHASPRPITKPLATQPPPPSLIPTLVIIYSPNQIKPGWHGPSTPPRSRHDAPVVRDGVPVHAAPAAAGAAAPPEPATRAGRRGHDAAVEGARPPLVVADEGHEDARALVALLYMRVYICGWGCVDQRERAHTTNIHQAVWQHARTGWVRGAALAAAVAK